LVIAFGSWFRSKLVLPFTLQTDKLKQDLRDICRIGMPTIFEQAVMQIGFIGFLWVIANYGTAAYAAYGTGVTLLSVSMVLGVGFSMAGSILVGQHLGAKDIAGARKAGWMAAKQSIIVMTVLGALAAYFAQELSDWLVGEGEVADKTALFLYVLCAAQPFLALDFALGGALRGAGDTRFPLVAAICGLVFFRFGLAMILLYFEADLVWVYATLIADYVMKNILYIKRFNSNRWEKKIIN
jgi:Na+-driven multidrug efflux pump